MRVKYTPPHGDVGTKPSPVPARTRCLRPHTGLDPAPTLPVGMLALVAPPSIQGAVAAAAPAVGPNLFRDWVVVDRAAVGAGRCRLRCCLRCWPATGLWRAAGSARCGRQLSRRDGAC